MKFDRNRFLKLLISSFQFAYILLNDQIGVKNERNFSVLERNAEKNLARKEMNEMKEESFSIFSILFQSISIEVKKHQKV